LRVLKFRGGISKRVEVRGDFMKFPPLFFNIFLDPFYEIGLHEILKEQKKLTEGKLYIYLSN
jgi:hypothetical protein